MAEMPIPLSCMIQGVIFFYPEHFFQSDGKLSNILLLLAKKDVGILRKAWLN
jgi:hypothetical protein